MGKLRKCIPSLIASVMLAALTVSAMSPEARRSFAEFEKRVEAGEPEALYRMSMILEEGYDSIPPDSVRSLSLLKESAEKGFGEAQNYLGYLYRRGERMPLDPDSAIYWFRKGAESGNYKALNNIAYLLLFPSDTERKFLPAEADSIAAAYLKKGTEAGLPTSEAMLAGLYLQGRGVPADTLQAEILYRSASGKGLAEADRELAVLMAEISATDTTGRALTLLGNAYAHARGVPYDYSKAIECYLMAAEKGNPAAMFILAESLDMFPDLLRELNAPDSFTADYLRSQAAEKGIATAEAAESSLLPISRSERKTGCDALPPHTPSDVPCIRDTSVHP